MEKNLNIIYATIIVFSLPIQANTNSQWLFLNSISNHTLFNAILLCDRFSYKLVFLHSFHVNSDEGGSVIDCDMIKGQDLVVHLVLGTTVNIKVLE